MWHVACVEDSGLDAALTDPVARGVRVFGWGLKRTEA
jgi:hypothetical protein